MEKNNYGLAMARQVLKTGSVVFIIIKISGVLVGECCLETTNNELRQGLESGER